MARAGNPCWTRTPDRVLFEVFHRRTLYVQFLAYLDWPGCGDGEACRSPSSAVDITRAKSVILERLQAIVNYGNRTRTGRRPGVAGFVRVTFARQPQFSAALDGADCQRSWGLVLFAGNLHAAAAIDRARAIRGARAGVASPSTNFYWAGSWGGQRSRAAKAGDDHGGPDTDGHSSGHAAGAIAIDGVAGISAIAAGDGYGGVLRAGAQRGDPQHH